MEIKLRELKGKDRKIILRILNKSGIKIIDIYNKVNKTVISVKDKNIEEFVDNLNEKDKNIFCELSKEEKNKIVLNTMKENENMKFILKLIDDILEKQELIDEELSLFIADLSGRSVDEIDDLNINDYASLILAVKDIFGKIDFFTMLGSK